MLNISSSVRSIAECVTYTSENKTLFFNDTQLEGDNIKSQTKNLALQIYATFHAGVTVAPTNNSDFVNDAALEEKILHASPIKWREAPVKLLETITQPEGAIVAYQGLKVFVPLARIIGPLDKAADTITIRLSAVEPRLSTGFCFFTNKQGAGNMSAPLRLYRYAPDPSELLPVWTEFIHWCGTTELPMRAKLLSRTHEYPRRDALVIYMPEEAWPHVDELAELLKVTSSVTDVSSFAKPLADGVSAAWEPKDAAIGRRQISFGEHRSEAVAEGIVADLVAGNTNHGLLIDRLKQANIDPRHVHRNLDSPAII